MAFKIKDGLQVGSVVSLTSTGIITNAAFSVADGTNGFLKKTGINTWTVDTNTYVTSSGVTSVGLSLPTELTVSNSPVTTTGSLTAAWASQTQKYFFAAPNAANGTPVFRAILASDIPTLNQTTSGTAGSVANSLTINNSGTGATSGATFNGSAAVTISYNTLGAAPLSHAHGDIANDGTYSSKSAKLALIAPNGTAGVPTFRQIVWSDIDSATTPTSLTPVSHVIATNTALGSEHTISGATAGAVLRASAATAANFQRLVWGDIDSKPTTVSGYGITDVYTKSEVYTKTEVDGAVTGLDFKQSVRVATTANITLSATQTIDGVAVVAGNRVLVKDQTAGAQNGIYVVAAGAWSRSTDADNTPAGEVTAGMYCFVEEGSTNSDSGWVLTTNDTITLGTTSLTFAQFNGLGQVTAGTGLSKSGSTLNHSNSVTGASIGDVGVTRTLAYGGTFDVSRVTFDNQGHVTAGSDITLTLPANTSEFGTASIATDSGFTWGTANTNTSQVADSVGDTLTFVAGTGINLFTSTIAGTDAIKIGHSNSVTGATIAEGGSTRTLAFGGVFNVPSVTYDAQGHVTSSTSVALTLPAAPTVVNSFTTLAVSGQNNIVADSSTDTLTLVAGTGISITTADTTDTITINHSNSVTGATIAEGGSTRTLAFGGTFNVPSVTYNAQGHVTSSTSVALTLPTEVAPGNGTLTLGVSGSGLSGSQTFTANQSTGSTFTVTSNATAASTASTIVFRDGSGDFAANIVTAEGVNLDSAVHRKYATATVSVNTETPIDTWAGATYRTCKYVVQITQGTNYYSSEIIVVHNGSSTSMAEYGIVELGTAIPVTFTSDFSTTTARLKATVTNAATTSAVFKISKTLLVV
jgi:hypothetical protein